MPPSPRLPLPLRLPLLVGLLLFLALLPGLAASQAPRQFTPWLEYQGDRASTGRSTVRGIANQPVVLWSRTVTFFPGEMGDGFALTEDGRVYVAAGGGIHALQAPEGLPLWSQTQLRRTQATPAIGPDGRLYIGSGDAFYVIRPDGTPEASVSPLSANFTFRSSATIGADGTIYVVHDALWAFEPTGEPKWVTPYGDFAQADPVIGPDGTIYGTAGLYTIAVNPDGTIRWALITGSGASSPSIGADGTLYVGNDQGEVFAITPEGTIVWRFQTDASPHAFSGAVPASPTIAEDGTIYVANSASLLASFPRAFLYALNPDGSLQWKYEIPGRGGDGRTGMNASVVLDRDGNLYGCALNGSCYSWTPEGKLRWEHVLARGQWIETTPLLVADGVIWVLSPNGAVYALGDPAAPILRTEPAALALRPCRNAAPFTATVAIDPGAPDVAWQASFTAELAGVSLPTPSGTGSAMLTIRVDPRVASSQTTFLRIHTTDSRVLNDTQLVPVTIAIGCPIYLPTFGAAE